MAEPATRPEVFGGPVEPYADGDIPTVGLDGNQMYEVSALGGFKTIPPFRWPETVYLPKAPYGIGRPWVKHALRGGFTQPDKYPYQRETYRAGISGPVIDALPEELYYHRPGDRFKDYYVSEDGVRYAYNNVTGKYESEGRRALQNAMNYLVPHPVALSDRQPPDIRSSRLPTDPAPPRTALKILHVPGIVLGTDVNTAPNPFFNDYVRGMTQ